MSDSPAAAAWVAMRALVLDHDRRREVSDALGMSFLRVKALQILAGVPGAEPMPLRQLGARLFTDPPYTTLVVDDLEARGLVSRAVHPGDRRAKTVALTDAGLATAERAERIVGEPPPALRALDPDDARTLARILTALLPTPYPTPPGRPR